MWENFIFLVIFDTRDVVYSWSISLLPPILLDNRFGVNKLFDISGSGAAQAAHEMTRGCRKICDLRQGLCSKETDMRLRAFPTYNGPGSNHANGSPSNSQVRTVVFPANENFREKNQNFCENFLSYFANFFAKFRIFRVNEFCERKRKLCGILYPYTQNTTSRIFPITPFKIKLELGLL